MIYCCYVTDPDLLTNPDHIANYGRVGALVTSSKDPIDPIPGTAVKQFARLDRLYTWDEGEQAPVYNRADRLITVEDFFARLTDAEEDAFLSSAPNALKQRLEHFRNQKKRFDLDGDKMTAILNAMRSAGILTAERAQEVRA